jgi:hypothetical protein
MHARHEYAYWHLTPRGWRCGTSGRSGQEQIVRPRPPDAVKTVRYGEDQPDAASAPVTTHRVISVSDAAAAASLEGRFGGCPAALLGEVDSLGVPAGP